MTWSKEYVTSHDPPLRHSPLSRLLIISQLVDLRNDPIDTKGLMGADANPLGGILGAALGESSAEAQARIEEATKTATDLSGLVRKKKPKDEPAAAESGGKRKAEEGAEEEESSKRAKTEELLETS